MSIELTSHVAGLVHDRSPEPFPQEHVDNLPLIAAAMDRKRRPEAESALEARISTHCTAVMPQQATTMERTKQRRSGVLSTSGDLRASRDNFQKIYGFGQLNGP